MSSLWTRCETLDYVWTIILNLHRAYQYDRVIVLNLHYVSTVMLHKFQSHVNASLIVYASFLSSTFVPNLDRHPNIAIPTPPSLSILDTGTPGRPSDGTDANAVART